MGICNIPIKTDLKNKSYNASQACKQCDTLILDFDIFDNSVMADLTGFVCDLRANKGDGKGYQIISGVTVIISAGKAIIKCPTSLTQFAGLLKLELTFTDTVNSLQKTTFDINIQVDKSVMSNSDGSAPLVIITALEELNKNLAQISSKVSEATAINNTLTNTKNAADSANSTLNLTINSANTSISNVGTAKANLDSSIGVANTLKAELLNENSVINQHINNADIHVTKEKKDTWDLAVLHVTEIINILDKLTVGTLDDENGEPWIDENGEQFIG